jgi:transposase
MREADSRQEGAFSYVSAGESNPSYSPAAADSSDRCRDTGRIDRKLESLYSQNCRPLIAPELLIRALVLQVVYAIRRETVLVKQLEYNLLFRLFVRCRSAPACDHLTFSKSRNRLFGAVIA